MDDEISLEQRVVVDGSDEVQFSECGDYFIEIAQGLYKETDGGKKSGNYFHGRGVSDRMMHNGTMTTILKLLDEFLSGKMDEDGRIMMGNPKGAVSAGLDIYGYRDRVCATYSYRIKPDMKTTDQR